MTSITERIAQIVSRLEWLQQQDGAATVFGASEHRYRTDNPLTDEALAAFEAEHDVVLPERYRAFLREVTDGGAGPYYGLSAIEPLVRDTLPSHHVVAYDSDGNELAAAGTGPREMPDVASTLARPFPLAAEWSPQDGPLPVADGTSPYDGCVHLAEQGCGYFDFLVVRGPAAGQVWSDYTAGDGAIVKCHDDFLDWYEQWLERAQIEWLEKNAIGMALWAPRNFPGIDDALALLEAGLERSPKWATGWRTLGYVRLNREQFDESLDAFEQAAEHGKDEPVARLHLDRARVARFRSSPEQALEELARGLSQNGIWASTKDELRKERLGALDHLERFEEALATLQDMIDNTYFHLDYHFDLALRRLSRDEADQAWATLDHAVTKNIGPNRHSEKATKESVYGQFADWLAECGEDELVEIVRAR